MPSQFVVIYNDCKKAIPAGRGQHVKTKIVQYKSHQRLQLARGRLFMPLVDEEMSESLGKTGQDLVERCILPVLFNDVEKPVREDRP